MNAPCCSFGSFHLQSGVGTEKHRRTFWFKSCLNIVVMMRMMMVVCGCESRYTDTTSHFICHHSQILKVFTE